MEYKPEILYTEPLPIDYKQEEREDSQECLYIPLSDEMELHDDVRRKYYR